MPEASRKEGPDLVGAGVKKLSSVGGCNGNLFERSEFISVQTEEDCFNPRRRSLDFCFFSSRKRRINKMLFTFLYLSISHTMSVIFASLFQDKEQ